MIMAAFLSIATMLIVIVFVSFVCPLADAVAPPPPTATPTVEGALVVYQWPMAYCQLNSGCDPMTIPDNRFLLHGVWPTDGQGVTITNCGVPFSYTAARNVRDLDLYWRGLNKLNKDFWKYEWDQHGSCSGQTVEDYFTNSRNLCKKYNKELYNKIVEAGFRPSSKTDMTLQGIPVAEDYYDVVKDGLNINPIIVCRMSAAGKVYLLEIRLCATADLLSFQNCTQVNDYSGCGEDPKNYKALFYTSSRRVRALDYLSVNATSLNN